VVVVLTSTLALAACSKLDGGAGQAEASAKPTKIGVETETLQSEALHLSAEYLAQLVSRHQVAVYSQVVGNVSAILVKPGEIVEPGATLLQIDPRRESANLDNLIAERAQKKASLALARSTDKRSERLLSEGLLSQQQYEQDHSLLDVAEQELKAKDAAIVAQGAQLTFYRISAPFGGAVGDIPIKLGDLVTPSLKLTSIDDNTNLEAYLNVPVDKLPLLAKDSVVQVLDAGHHVTAEAKVSFVASEANAAAQSVLVKAVIPNTTSLRAMQLVRARLVFRSYTGVRVSLPAVVRQSGQYFVFIVESASAGTVARQRAVELGDLEDDHYQVLKGLLPGDRVIVSQLQKLHDGAPVEATTPLPSSSASVAPAPSPSATR
jgi:RND family efflux transporter MFP subunit